MSTTDKFHSDMSSGLTDHRKKAVSVGEELFSQATKAHEAGDLTTAHFLCERLLESRPEHAGGLSLLGVIACQRADPAAGIVHIAKACALEPDNAGFVNNLGTAFSALGRDHDALVSYQRVLELDPSHATAHNNIATIYRALGRLDQASEHFNQAIKLRPDYAEALSNYGNVLLDLGQIDEASRVLEKAIALSPGYAYAHNNLGIVRQRQGRFSEAESIFRDAIQLATEMADPYTNLAEVLKETGRIEEAIPYYQKSLKLAPDHPSVHSNYLYALQNLDTVSTDDLFEAHKLWNDRHAAKPLTVRPAISGKKGKLRIGYVSPDFRRHSVSYFFEPLIANHDHQNFEITCYSNGMLEDEVTARLRSHADQWRDIFGMFDVEVAELIQQDEIDILVDLSGHTMGNRLSLFTLRPAPIQVTYLGYPSTTGVAGMDYRITDAFADPVGDADAVHSEKLVRLDGGFLCYRPADDAPEVAPLPYLSNGYITFGSCNNLSKITPQVIAVWAAILRAVPDAQLLLKGKALGDDTVRVHFMNAFAAHGIEAARLDLRAWITGPSHLSIYDHMDIALDSFPYNGTTTICETLWMGVPTVALEGGRHAARVALSLNAMIGQHHLIATSVDDYVRLAKELAANPSALVKMRADLRGVMKASGLCDGLSFARSLEKAYKSMWENRY